MFFEGKMKNKTDLQMFRSLFYNAGVEYIIVLDNNPTKMLLTKNTIMLFSEDEKLISVTEESHPDYVNVFYGENELVIYALKNAHTYFETEWAKVNNDRESEFSEYLYDIRRALKSIGERM